MTNNIELIAYGVRKGLERDFNLEVSLTYPPSASAMGQSVGYTSVISLSQRIKIDYNKFLQNSLTKRISSYGVKNPDTIYVYYRNKITRAQAEPELSSIEIGVFEQEKFIQLAKFHVAGLDDVTIIKEIKQIIGKTVNNL